MWGQVGARGLEPLAGAQPGVATPGHQARPQGKQFCSLLPPQAGCGAEYAIKVREGLGLVWAGNLLPLPAAGLSRTEGPGDTVISSASSPGTVL